MNEETTETGSWKPHFDVLSKWPSNKYSGLQIEIDPQGDLLLVNFLKGFESAWKGWQGPDDEKIKLASEFVKNSIPYDEEYFEYQIEKKKKQYLGRMIVEGGVCTVYALAMHTALAQVGRETTILRDAAHTWVRDDLSGREMDPTNGDDFLVNRQIKGTLNLSKFVRPRL